MHSRRSVDSHTIYNKLQLEINRTPLIWYHNHHTTTCDAVCHSQMSVVCHYPVWCSVAGSNTIDKVKCAINCSENYSGSVLLNYANHCYTEFHNAAAVVVTETGNLHTNEQYTWHTYNGIQKDYFQLLTFSILRMCMCCTQKNTNITTLIANKMFRF